MACPVGEMFHTQTDIFCVCVVLEFLLYTNGKAVIAMTHDNKKDFWIK